MSNKKIFSNFKNKHDGQAIAFFGSGPTLLKIDFKKIKKNILRGGLNQQIFLKDINLDYWFQGDACKQDMTRFYDHYEKYDNYIPNIQKFIRICNWGLDAPVVSYKKYKVKQNGQTPLGMKNSLYYKADSEGNTTECKFIKDIDKYESINCQRSITFEALQFYLFAGFKKIYLIGHDCNYSSGTYDGCLVGKKLNAGYYIFEYWKLVIPWIEKNYKDVKIVWVNPNEKIVKELNIFKNIVFSNEEVVYE